MHLLSLRTRHADGSRLCTLSAAALAMLLAGRPPQASEAGPPGQGQQPPLPARFDAYVTAHVKLTADQRKRLLAGEPVARHLAADPAKEVAIFGAVWVDAPVARYLAAVKDIESFESGDNFLVTRRISNPPRLTDFDKLSLPAEDIADMEECKIGSCEVQLGEAALSRIQRTTDWSKATASGEVNRAMRARALEYVNAYREGGNSRLAVYRDAERPTFVAEEFATMVNGMPEMTNYLPGFKRYLLEYPKAVLPDAESFLYWQSVKFGLKPTIRINHVTIANQQTHAVVMSKMLYATHYFWTAIEVRVLVPDPARGDGFWFANVNRSRANGLDGFIGSIIRNKVRAGAEDGMQATLAMTKSRMEGR
jgi:hypothetical protein